MRPGSDRKPLGMAETLEVIPFPLAQTLRDRNRGASRRRHFVGTPLAVCQGNLAEVEIASAFFRRVSSLGQGGLVVRERALVSANSTASSRDRPIETIATVSVTSVTSTALAATPSAEAKAGLRRHHRQSRWVRLTGRARIGSLLAGSGRDRRPRPRPSDIACTPPSPGISGTIGLQVAGDLGVQQPRCDWVRHGAPATRCRSASHLGTAAGPSVARKGSPPASTRRWPGPPPPSGLAACSGGM